MRVFDLLQKGDNDLVEIGSWLESNQIIAGDRGGARNLVARNPNLQVVMSHAQHV